MKSVCACTQAVTNTVEDLYNLLASKEFCKVAYKILIEQIASIPHKRKQMALSLGGGGAVGGVVASWLVRSTSERAVRVRALAGDIVLCSWARHFTLTVPLSTQVYKWVPASLLLGGNPAMD